jgi:hypothetical protein
MQRTVALLNIEHLRKRLTEVTDKGVRQTILQLLAEEEAKLEAMTSRPRKEEGMARAAIVRDMEF